MYIMEDIFNLNSYIANNAEDVFQALPVVDLVLQATLAGEGPSGKFKAKETPLGGAGLGKVGAGEPVAPQSANPLGSVLP